ADCLKGHVDHGRRLGEPECQPSSPALADSLTVHYMQCVYDAYKVRIDAKIASIRDRGKPCSEQTTLAYAGEFGYEIQGVVPWRHDEAISTGCDLKTAGLAGNAQYPRYYIVGGLTRRVY
ncbi:hypothetical protein THAOC_23196, partial [Thalassiosira oceanica]